MVTTTERTKRPTRSTQNPWSSWKNTAPPTIEQIVNREAKVGTISCASTYRNPLKRHTSCPTPLQITPSTMAHETGLRYTGSPRPRAVASSVNCFIRSGVQPPTTEAVSGYKTVTRRCSASER